MSHRAARCRLAQGWLAAGLLSRRGWFALGFVRLGDYTSERLGLGARILEEEARVALRLSRLPQLTAAFLDGSIPWTAVRLIVGVATDRDEDRWIKQAASLDTRSLSKLVRAAAATAPTVADADSSAPRPSTEEGEDGQTGDAGQHGENEDVPPQRWTVRVSPSGRRLWRAACEMASRTAGARLTPAQVLELVAAEASSGGTGGVFDSPCSQVDSDGSRDATAGSKGTGAPCRAPTDPPPCTPPSFTPPGSVPGKPATNGHARAGLLELLAAEIERTAGAPEARRLAFLTLEDARELLERDPELAAFYAEELAGKLADVETGNADQLPPPPRPEPGWFGRALRGIGLAEGFEWLQNRPVSTPSTPTERLEAEMGALEDADPHTIDARLREVRRSAQALDFELAGLLDEAASRRLHGSFGLANFELYVESRLGLRPRTAWSLLSIGRAARRCSPLLGKAWRDGRISTLAARVLLPVVGRAGGGASDNDGHPDNARPIDNDGCADDDSPSDTDRQWIARAGVVTLRRLEAEVTWALNRRDEPGAAASAIAPPPLDLDLAGAPLADVTIAGLQMRAQGCGPDPSAAGELPGVSILLFAPESVILLAERTLEGLRGSHESRGRAFERMVALAMLEWMTAPKHPDPVFERDGWTCAVPGCRSRRNLHDHHVVFRSQGGDNARDNRLTVCAAHHLHGLHRGRIRASGRAPHAIHWELGVRFGFDAGRPLARLVGDRYLEGR